MHSLSIRGAGVARILARWRKPLSLDGSAEAMLREGASAILFDTDGNLLLQLRDDIPDIRDPGKISLFGGRREGDESFLDCIVREIHEEIGYYLAPTRFESIGRWDGPDYAFPGHHFRGEIFLARAVPVELLTITEGRLTIVPLDEIDQIRSCLSLAALYALGILLKGRRTSL